MASIVEAVETSVTSATSWLKILTFAVPVFISYNLYKSGETTMFYIVGGITVLLLFLYMSMIFQNVRNCTNKFLPSFNPLTFIKVFFKAIFALAPTYIALGFLGYWLTGLEIPVPVEGVQTVYVYIVWILLASVMMTSFMLFSESHSIVKAYDFGTISKHCVDVAIGIFFFIVKLCLVNLIFVGSVYYVFSVFNWLELPVFAFLCSVFFVINVFASGNYLAQVDYEAIPDLKKEKSNSLY